MAKEKSVRAGAKPGSPKRLRRTLEKLEARLTSASDKRDRAQARVDALTILTDEVRASLAAAEAPSAPEAATAPSTKARASAAAAPKATTTPRAPRTPRTTSGRTTRSSTTRRTTPT